MLAEAAQTKSGDSIALQQRVLADFDRLAARRLWLTSRLVMLSEWLWPGAPLWQPAAALALSLAIGVFVGTLAPFDGLFDNDAQTVAFTTDQPNDFSEDL